MDIWAGRHSPVVDVGRKGMLTALGALRVYDFLCLLPLPSSSLPILALIPGIQELAEVLPGRVVGVERRRE